MTDSILDKPTGTATVTAIAMHGELRVLFRDQSSGSTRHGWADPLPGVQHAPGDTYPATPTRRLIPHQFDLIPAKTAAAS